MNLRTAILIALFPFVLMIAAVLVATAQYDVLYEMENQLYE